MKKLFAIFAMSLSLATFANSPPLEWDKPLMEKKVVFSDPIITDFSITETAIPKKLDFWVKMDHAVNYRQKLVVMVYGYWEDLGDWWPKYFDIYIQPGQTIATLTAYLDTYDDPIPEFYDLYELGPG